MSNLDAAAYAALSPLFPGAAWPNTSESQALEYVTWNAYTVPQVYAERLPAAARYPTQVHYFLPHGIDPTDKKLAIQQALFDAGFTWPSNIVDASDREGQHYVFECEYVNAGGVYGYA